VHPPQAKGNTVRNPTNMFLTLFGGIAAVGGVAAVQLIVPNFHEVFKNFGAELPLLSRIFVNGRMFLWVLPLLVPIAAAFVRVRSPDDGRRGVVALLLGLAIGIGLPMLCVLAMYLPIFGLAAQAE
jgi:type II secretory pathway component PulF